MAVNSIRRSAPEKYSLQKIYWYIRHKYGVCIYIRRTHIYLRTFVVFSLSPAPVRSVMIRSCCPILVLSGARRLFFAHWTGFGPPTISTWLRWDAARAGDRSSCPGVSVSSKLYHVIPVFFFFGGWRFSPISPPLFSCGTRCTPPRRKHIAFPTSTSIDLHVQFPLFFFWNTVHPPVEAYSFSNLDVKSISFNKRVDYVPYGGGSSSRSEQHYLDGGSR